MPLFILENINPWQKFFTELIEVVYIVMKDGRFFKQTSHYENEVYMGIADLERELKRHNYKIKDIAIVIHNHFKIAEFRGNDRKCYRGFKRRGFKGLFLLYCHRTNKTYCLEDKEKTLQKTTGQDTKTNQALALKYCIRQ